MTIETGETPPTYYLSEGFLGGHRVEIAADQYEVLSEALTTVVSALEIEELFQVFAQSFLRFEKDILDVAFEFTYANSRVFDNDLFFSSIRHRFNVNIITLLTSYRSYDDHCNRILKTAINPKEMREFNSQLRRKAFDNHLSYRICSRLRDYAQHRALPLGGFSVGGKANFHHDADGKVRKLDSGYNVYPWLNVSKFKSSSQCKAPLREELEGLGYEKIDMKWLIRSFAGAMYERHAALRAFLKPEVVAAGEKISAGYDFASKVKNSEAKHLELRGPDGERAMRNDLVDKVLSEFEDYVSLQRAERSYVTSRIVPDAATYSGQPDA